MSHLLHREGITGRCPFQVLVSTCGTSTMCHQGCVIAGGGGGRDRPCQFPKSTYLASGGTCLALSDAVSPVTAPASAPKPTPPVGGTARRGQQQGGRGDAGNPFQLAWWQGVSMSWDGIEGGQRSDGDPMAHDIEPWITIGIRKAPPTPSPMTPIQRRGLRAR